ncbi:hypothetical protein SAMN04487897_102740 [Paenibacillus sp. yr247]|uniref:hypothetical protein n=1 Tax=Paenibacillus sp. yr247 TaxID=1761880 RepID=UPI00088B9F44|nr:hypothetical protein [Paenibacillus sp. yr247]SDN38845.1 hypothetical protein SAMN04487897_102740 [Paenibacillus sp. yr247]
MNNKQLEEQMIENYKREEHMMILVFAQWCINHDLDPAELYHRAYPDQPNNAALQQALELTVPKEEAGEVPDDTLFGVLSLFGNEELAFIVTQEIEKRPRDKR